jgi:hypothetical protein
LGADSVEDSGADVDGETDKGEHARGARMEASSTKKSIKRDIFI